MTAEAVNDHKAFISDGLENDIIVSRYLISSVNHSISNGDEITKVSEVFQLASVFWFAAVKYHPTGIVKSSDWPRPPEMFEVLESALPHRMLEGQTPLTE